MDRLGFGPRKNRAHVFMATMSTNPDSDLSLIGNQERQYHKEQYWVFDKLENVVSCSPRYSLDPIQDSWLLQKSRHSVLKRAIDLLILIRWCRYSQDIW